MKTKKQCHICGDPADTTYTPYTGGGSLCRRCARLDVIGWLSDCDTEEVKQLKERALIELKANTAFLEPGKAEAVIHAAVIEFIIDGKIQYEDML